MTGFRWEIVQEYAPLFAEGAWMTIKCTTICVILGTLWGLTLGLGRMAKAENGPWRIVLRYFVQWPVRVYVSAFRGTPLFVQIMVVHFALVPLLINPRDGVLVTSGLISPVCYVQITARFSLVLWRSHSMQARMYQKYSVQGYSQSITDRWRHLVH